MKLSKLGEDALIRTLTRRLPTSREVIVGPGDDCAVVATKNRSVYELLKTDAIVESVHFLRSQPAQKVGWKAIARAISDVAAMGGTPRFALVSLASPPDLDLEYWRKFYQGLTKAAQLYDVTIVGGETTRSPGPIIVTLTLTGIVNKKHLVRRDGGQPGDSIWVTGKLGGSLSGRHLTFTPRVPEAAWLVRHFRPSAMMDLSDGLAKDLPRLATASGVGYSIDWNALPRNRGCSIAQALNDGEDYELLFTLAARGSEKLKAAWARQFPRIRLTRIGELKAPKSVGARLHGGFDHFRVD